MTRTELMIYARQEYDKAIANHTYKVYSQLNYCQAQYVDTGSSVILKSYNTIVAIYNKYVGTLYVFDYFSNTSQKHISKFAELLAWDRITYLYMRSDKVLEKSRYCNKTDTYKPITGEWTNLFKHDFSMVITNRWE